MTKESNNKFNWELIAPLVVTVLLAISGYVYTHLSNRADERNTAKIDRVNDQLRYLYGPLYSFASISDITWKKLVKDYPGLAKIDSAHLNSQLTNSEKEAYRIYMLEVIRPYQLNAESAILNYSDLIDGDEMPLLFQQLAAHIADAKKLYSHWLNGDFTQHVPTNKYPANFKSLITKKYQQLRLRQVELLGVDDHFN